MSDTPTTTPIPTIGRLVHYTLSADDAFAVNRRRTNGHSIRERLEGKFHTAEFGEVAQWPAGAQAHIGNEAKEGQVVPMLIVQTWGDTPGSAVNGQAFLDGNDVLWVTSVCVGTTPRTFSWPVQK